MALVISNREGINRRILGMLLIAASLLLVTTGYQNAIASTNSTVEGNVSVLEESAESQNGTAMTAAGTSETATATTNNNMSEPIELGVPFYVER